MTTSECMAKNFVKEYKFSANFAHIYEHDTGRTYQF